MWDAIGPLRLFIIVGLLVAMDAGVGLSNRAARQIGRSERADVVLFLMVTICTAAIIFWFHTHISVQGEGFVDYNRVEDIRRQFIRDKADISREKTESMYISMLIAAEILFATFSLILSIRQKRSIFIWIPLSLLGNVGSVVWLLANGLARRVK